MIVIDGHNLLWALHDRLEGREVGTEIELCRALDRYFALTREDGQVIFDGAGPSDRGAFESIMHVEVIFAGYSQDADSIVEEKIKANTAPRRLTVVSSDRRLRKAAAARKAAAMKSEDFWDTVQKELRRNRPHNPEPEEKNEGLTQGEAEQWMDLFGLDE